MNESGGGTEEACAKMWSVYILQVERYDKALVAGWRARMKGTLIFVRAIRISPRPHVLFAVQAGLFSGGLTTFIIESYPTLVQGIRWFCS